MKRLGWYEFKFRRYDGQWIIYATSNLKYEEIEKKTERVDYQFDEFYDSDRDHDFFYRRRIPIINYKYIESALGDKLTAKKYPVVNLLVKWHDASAPTMDRIIKELSTDELSEYFRDKKINIF